MNFVIPPENYSFNPSQNSIALLSPYDTVSVGQVMSIKDITKKATLYDCNALFNGIITLAAGVITVPREGILEEGDDLQIIVNGVVSGGTP